MSRPTQSDYLASSVIFALAALASVVSLWLTLILVVAWVCAFGMSRN